MQHSAARFRVHRHAARPLGAGTAYASCAAPRAALRAPHPVAGQGHQRAALQRCSAAAGKPPVGRVVKDESGAVVPGPGACAAPRKRSACARCEHASTPVLRALRAHAQPDAAAPPRAHAAARGARSGSRRLLTQARSHALTRSRHAPPATRTRTPHAALADAASLLPRWLPPPPELGGAPARSWSPAALAFIGDAVWEVRRAFVCAREPHACSLLA
jgi:hypothetical protein